METIKISVEKLILFYFLILIPIAIAWKLGIPILKDLFWGTLRMTAQLFWVGLYLKYILRSNHPILIFGWFSLMVLIANGSILKRAGLLWRPFFLPLLVGTFAGTFFVSFIIIVFLVGPSPLYDGRYVIPFSGMILGNCLKGNILSLERFYSTVKEEKSTLLANLTMGASIWEATSLIIVKSIEVSLSPHLAMMTTMGLVAIPGMMTGQILGGTFPMVAIQYQIIIMIGILVSLSISTIVNLSLSIKIAFDERGNLKESFFRSKKKL